LLELFHNDEWSNSMKQEFLKEFKALLEKYNVGISFSVSDCSDTYGLSDEKLVVYHREPKTYHTETWLEVDGWALDKNDIE
jgi:hypothetical protein